MTAQVSIAAADASFASALKGWRAHLAALGALSAFILLLFHRDVAEMGAIWLESETFNHCALVAPIIFWLVWQRLPELRQLEPRAWWPGLLLVGAGGGGWLLGEAGGVALARHAGLILMLQGAVIAALGPQVSRGLAFPIFYALFMIPAGEGMVPPLQQVTAVMSMFLLKLAGIPAHLEGIFITTPTGYFEVAEACSGVQFLIAMIAYGALVANVCFRSWKRRAMFMAAAVVIPILANGVRAWGTIFIAHHTSIEFAAGFDHIFYGWIFFALVIVLLMAAGWRFFDRGVNDPWFDPAELRRTRGGRSPLLPVALAAAGLAALPVAWSGVMASMVQPVPPRIEFPDVPGWQKVPISGGRTWQPHFAGADLLAMRRYQNAEGQSVDLAIAVFARQDESREIVGFGQGAAGSSGPWAWSGSGEPPLNGRLDRIASFGTVRDVASFYRVGNILTGNQVAVKLETVKARLMGGPQRAVAVMVSAPQPAEGVSPRPAIDAFIRALGPIDRLADKAAGLPQP